MNDHRVVGKLPGQVKVDQGDSVVDLLAAQASTRIFDARIFVQHAPHGRGDRDASSSNASFTREAVADHA